MHLTYLWLASEMKMNKNIKHLYLRMSKIKSDKCNFVLVSYEVKLGKWLGNMNRRTDNKAQ